MKIYLHKIIFPALFLLCALQVQAQTGSGSMTVDNSTVNLAAGTTEQRFSEGSYFGPNANWTIDGTLEIWSKNIWIAPGATFKGIGKIVIHNPGANPFYIDMASGPTNIDGNNGAFIGMLLEHRNDDNIVLADVADPGYNTINPQGVLSATLNIGAELNLAVNKADVILNGHNLTFNTSGKISNYSASRMVVTSNSVVGHMVKEYANSSSFVFPVGIAEGDYTPATLTPTSATTLYVGVQDYTASAVQGLDYDLGMNRNWNIYAANPVKADMTLQHNMNTNGIKFDDKNALITKFAGAAQWDELKTTNPSLGIHTSLNVELLTASAINGVWFTKSTSLKPNFFIPNVITPNGDGKNDRFVIVGLEFFNNADVTIFNRWGNEVYRNNNYKNTWAGEGLNEGTYYYLIKLRKADKVDVYKGWVLIK